MTEIVITGLGATTPLGGDLATTWSNMLAGKSGVRRIQLSVAGAFHTVHMQPAVATLEQLAATLSPHDPSTVLLSNADGRAIDNGTEFLRRLVSQVGNPVRWDLCLDALRDLGVTGVLELPPAGTLTGIAKRNLKGVALFNLNTPDQLTDARAFVAEHAGVAA